MGCSIASRSSGMSNILLTHGIKILKMGRSVERTHIHFNSTVKYRTINTVLHDYTYTLAHCTVFRHIKSILTLVRLFLFTVFDHFCNIWCVLYLFQTLAKLFGLFRPWKKIHILNHNTLWEKLMRFRLMTDFCLRKQQKFWKIRDRKPTNVYVVWQYRHLSHNEALHFCNNPHISIDIHIHICSIYYFQTVHEKHFK